VELESILLKLGHVDEELLRKAREIRDTRGVDVEKTLLESGAITDQALEEARRLQTGLDSEDLENKQTFLASIVPFDSLSREALGAIAEGMEWVHHRPRDIIIKQGSPGTHFYVIKTGLARVYLSEDGKETVLAFLGEGECFGEMSLLNREPTNATIQVTEEILALRQTEEKFLAMVHTYPLFYKFFNQLLTKRMKRIYKELLAESPGIGQVEPFLFRKQISEILPTGQQFCKENETIQEVAGMMLGGEPRAVIVIDDRTKPRGLVGTNQILRSVLIDGVSPEGQVHLIMDPDFHTVDINSFFFDALHEMVKHKTDRLIAVDRGKAVGVVTGLDMLRFRGREVLSLVRNLETAQTTAELNTLRTEIEKVLKALVSDGALASQACRIVSELNDRMVRRVLQVTEEEQGPLPCPYAWLGLGSEGRKEQTLLTDQDNAILFSVLPSKETAEYFNRFSQKVVNSLAECGLPLCKGDIMATNPKYFGDMEEWKKRTAYWVTTAVRQASNLADLYVFLDFRTTYGEQTLEGELKSHIAGLIQQNGYFLKTLAQSIVEIPMPLGFFKNFIVEKNGKYKNRINLKNYGLVPLVTCIKLLAWNKGVIEVNTLERIRALTQAGVFSSDLAEFIEQAFETFLTLRIRNNLNDLEQGKEPTNYLDPASLSTRQKQLLKEAFLAVSQLQKSTRETLKTEMQV
jgi:CBS domain-containing protein